MSVFSGYGFLGINVVFPVVVGIGLLMMLIGWLLNKQHDKKMKRDAMKYMSKEESELYSLSDRKLIHLAKEQIKETSSSI